MNSLARFSGQRLYEILYVITPWSKEINGGGLLGGGYAIPYFPQFFYPFSANPNTENEYFRCSLGL